MELQQLFFLFLIIGDGTLVFVIHFCNELLLLGIRLDDLIG